MKYIYCFLGDFGATKKKRKRIYMEKKVLLSGIYGLAIGDALGVPVESKSRDEVRKKPVRKMIGFGIHLQEKGTWSDDTALSLATLNALSQKPYKLENVAQNFVRWYKNGDFAIHHKVFDIGRTTSDSIYRLELGVDPLISGEIAEKSNGNGSLMRMLPLAFFLESEPDIMIRKQVIYEISSLTHAHMRSKIACHIYVELAIALIHHQSIEEAYQNTREKLKNFYETKEPEISYFQRFLSGELLYLEEDKIRSTGYVVYSLEACVWCVLHTRNYKEAVLTAVNLGGDTDTIAALAGGLAGILYGVRKIPRRWIRDVKGKEILENEIAYYIMALG